MKSALIVPLVAIAMASTAYAQSRTWRCGNTYTNIAADAQANRDCKIVEGGNVTIVTSTRVASPVRVATATQASPATVQRIDSGEQRARDSDARAILEAELKKAEAKQAELLREWNNGEPEKLGPEHRNHQKYLDRVAELKASIARNENDIAGLRRELGRSGGTAAK